VTVSRDGSAKLWEIGTRYNPFCTCILEFSPFSGAAVTAVDILTTVRDRIVLAVGSEEGDLSVWALSSSNEAMSPAYTCSTTANGSHGLAVTRIRWRPNIVSGEDEVMHSLASCGEDNCVRIHKVRIE
jgi:WD40 repeat protein